MLMCRDLATIASEYIDGDMTMGRRFSIRMHLLMCRHCRSFITNMRNSTVLIQAHSSSQSDPAFLRRINAEIDRSLESRQ